MISGVAVAAGGAVAVGSVAIPRLWAAVGAAVVVIAGGGGLVLGCVVCGAALLAVGAVYWGRRASRRRCCSAGAAWWGLVCRDYCVIVVPDAFFCAAPGAKGCRLRVQVTMTGGCGFAVRGGLGCAMVAEAAGSLPQLGA